ncbi:MAG: MAPEG family protein [Deltaproteobacteria bacterium]|nr:MAPEG family protein [Deltaproteobacteria bacterium]MBW2418794.1 MAPEG family protein [Deltaproteobacteria bacterium]
MEITQHPAFATFAFCAAFLVLKMLVVGHISGIWRIRKLAYLNPEDAKAFSQIEETRLEEDPDIARTLRAHRNDLESTLPFLAIGLVYLAVDPSPGLAKGLIITFTVFRTLFSVFYLAAIQPWRSLSFIVGELCVIVMLGQIFWWAVAG